MGDKTLKVMLGTAIPHIVSNDGLARTWAGVIWNVLNEYHHVEEAQVLQSWLRTGTGVEETVRKLRALEAAL